MSKKVVLNLKGIGIGATKEHTPTEGCCRNHMVVLPGYGQRNFPFPDAQTLVINALGHLEKKHGKSAPQEEPDNEAGEPGETHGHPHASHEVQAKYTIRFDHTFLPGHPTKGQVPQPLIPTLPDSETKGLDGTLFAAAEGLRIIMDAGKYDAIVAERFDPLAGAVNWAREHMDEKYQPAVSSLGEQLSQLQDLYKQALPRVLSVLAAQNPNVPGHVLLEAAVDALDEELKQILYVLRIWTDAFGQLRDGMYKQLQAVVFTVEQAFALFETGDLKGDCDHKDGKCRPKLETNKFDVGNVFVARFSSQGPATLPGTRGPIGAHAIEVPHDERNIITLMLVLYTHEFRHDIFADVKGLAPELKMAVVNALTTAHEEGKFHFTTDTIAFGRNKFPIIEMLAKFSVDTIGEVDADICGGVQSSGPAFLYNMIPTFAAFNTRSQSIFRADRLLRTGSFYELSEQGNQMALDFLPHPPDYIRAYIVAAALDEIGFHAEAAECRNLADQAVGAPLPQFITWADAAGKEKAVIKIAISDIKQIAPVVAKALIRTPLKALGGLSTWDVVNWTPKRQAKVDLLAQNLMRGKSDVPTDKGDIYATYVAAAATLAYWGLVKSGVRPLHAAKIVEDNALKMIDTVRERLNQPATLVPAAGCGCVGDDHSAHSGADKPVEPTAGSILTPPADGEKK